jgi:cation diffusion facilitator family transporter
MKSRPTTPAEARDVAAAAARRGERAAAGSLLVNAALAVVKILAGVLGNSYALIADGTESLLDVFSSLIVWSGLRVAASEPTDRFPYGRGKAEPLAGVAIAAALLLAAAVLAIQSVREILTPHHAPAPFTLLVLVSVIAIKEVMFRRLSRTAADIESRAIESDAWHHRSDAITSAAAFIGISIALWGGEGYESADDWAALVACAFIAFNGFRLMRAALADVLDAAPADETLLLIRATAETIPGVVGVESCRARKSGLGWLVDIHVEVDGDLPVREGHRLAHEVKDALLGADLNVLDALVHIEPATDSP